MAVGARRTTSREPDETGANAAAEEMQLERGEVELISGSTWTKKRIERFYSGAKTEPNTDKGLQRNHNLLLAFEKLGRRKRRWSDKQLISNEECANSVNDPRDKSSSFVSELTPCLFRSQTFL
jgi:hypothetical protein